MAFPEPLMAHQDVLVEEFVNGEPVSRHVSVGGVGGGCSWMGQGRVLFSHL